MKLRDQATRFKSQSLSLFFIVSLIPALVVAAVWYVNSITNESGILVLDFRTFVLPVFFLGIIPAFLVSFLFAELLARPVRRIHAAVLELARGHLNMRFKNTGGGEFREITVALDAVSTKLQAMLSQAASEQAIISAERNKLRGVLNAMTDGVFALDGTGRIILFNKAASELTGRTIESVAGQLAEKVMPFRQDGELVMTRWLATQSGQAGDSQHVGQWHNLELYRADGTSLIVDVQAVVLPSDPNGISALITFHDLTAGAQLEQMKVDFVALAAHELRTPLTELKGYLDILQSEAKGLTKDNRDFLARSVESAAQLSGLMNNLLGVARIEHGELNYQPEDIDYLAFLRDLEHELHERFDAQERTLTLRLPDELPDLRVDVIGLREILLNLINNAVSHTERGKGVVTLSVTKHRDTIQTSVTDNGTGIPADAMPHLFTKFFRVGEMSATSRGTGLGLYICRSIVEAHGGKIWAESTEGKGATFTFRLPMEPVAENPDQQDNNPKITRGAHGWIKEHTVH